MLAGGSRRVVCAGRPNPWAGLFNATCLTSPGLGRGIHRHNLDVTRRFVGDPLHTLRPPPVGELARGEGGIRDLHGEKVAAYRDEDGRLYAVSGRCTHLGCLVAWNAAERTWDGPCHGSRYAYDGKAIHGPAVDDLQPKPPVGPPS
jgi:Rieske Fe-S protein